MVSHPPLSFDSGTSISNPTEFRAIVGSLQYLSLTRLDVAFIVIGLSQYMHKITNHNFVALKRLLRYFAGTLHHDLLLHRNSPTCLHAFSNTDWASEKDEYISTTGYVVHLGRNPILWSSRKQKILAFYSTKA